MTEVIEVRERGRTILSNAVVASVPPAFWQTARCKVTKAAGDQAWVLEAGDSVGVTRILTATNDTVLRVQPKLDTADVFFLADYAYEQRHDPLRLLQHDDVGFQSLLRDPSACLLAWHAQAIHRFAARWLRRDYRTVDRTFEAKIKGRPLINAYVARHLAVGDAARIPCRVQERTQDTPNNRLLKAGLRFIMGASHTLPIPAARRVVRRTASAALPLFAQVSDVTVGPLELRAVSSRGPLRHYRSILDATAALLQGQLMGDELLPTHSTTSFMWDMPTLFQEGLRGVIASAPTLTLLPTSVGTARIRDSSGKQLRSSRVDPDLVLRTGDQETVLLDTKYKDALPSDNEPGDTVSIVAERHRVNVSRSDIYQMVAYTHHEKWLNATGALLYPTVLAQGDELPRPLQVDGFGKPIWMVFVDIGPNASANLTQFVDAIHDLLGAAATIAA